MLLDDRDGRFRSFTKAPGMLRNILRLWPLLLPLTLFLPGINGFAFPSEQARYSDLVLAHYPYAFYLRQAILQGQGFPTWSPLILSGAPLAGNPLASMWYPPAWLALIFPLPLGFNLAIMAHVLWGGIGMYLLLRGEKMSHRAALFGALAFEAMPKLFAHYGAGHLTLLYAVNWTPWLLWSTSRNNDRIFGFRFNWRTAAILALVFLADVRWTAYAALLWWGYAFAHIRWEGNSNRTNRLELLPKLLSQTLAAALLAAPLGLPLLEYTRLSTRSQMTVENILEFSLPASRLLGLLFPDLGGFHEWMLYVGGAVLLLSLLTMAWSASISGARFWAWTAGLAFIFSLGSAIPLMPFIARLPGFNLLRAPSRALFLASMALAVLSAYAVDGMLNGITKAQSKRGGMLLVGLCGFTLALALGVYILSGRLAMNFLWGSVVILVSGVWIGLRLAERVPIRAWFIGLLVLCLLDWAYVDQSLFTPRQANMVFSEARQLASYLASQQGLFRVYSPSYSLPQQTSANYGLQLADGVDPLQMQAYVGFMQAASGVPNSGYQVTLPPFASGDPSSANASYLPDLQLLGLLNVRFVAAEFDLEVNGLIFIRQFGNTRLYENSRVMPRAWIQPADSSPGRDVRGVDIARWAPERIELHARGPGLLILSELAYPGWSVSVDGAPASLETVSGLLRGVQITEGDHEVIFFYRPLSLYLGLSLCVGVIIFLVVGSILGKDRDYSSNKKFQKQDETQENPEVLGKATSS